MTEDQERQHMLAQLDLLIAIATIELQFEERAESDKQRTRELPNPGARPMILAHWLTRKAS